MSKYIIQCCNQRQWYVEEFLIPSMLKQGVSEDDILLYIDTERKGNLVSFIESCRLCYDKWGKDDYTWHLQDDVIISSVFKQKTEELDFSRKGIVCGFTCRYEDDNRPPGEGPIISNMWWSFPCIRIPNKLGKEFAIWVEQNNIWQDPQFRFWVKYKKGDDLVFRVFLEENYPNELVYNISPNLVDHIDYLLGGSVVNKQRSMENTRSMYWDENNLVVELENKLKNY